MLSLVHYHRKYPVFDGIRSAFIGSSKMASPAQESEIESVDQDHNTDQTNTDQTNTENMCNDELEEIV